MELRGSVALGGSLVSFYPSTTADIKQTVGRLGPTSLRLAGPLFLQLTGLLLTDVLQAMESSDRLGLSLFLLRFSFSL